MKKEVNIISPFDNYCYPVRTKYIEDYYIKNGYAVKIYAADFNHRKKEYYDEKRTGLFLLHVRSYKKNISIARIVSHIGFAKQVMRRIKENNPSVLYICTPPNVLFLLARKYKKINKDTKIIFDIIDVWPETLPVDNRFKNYIRPFLLIWKELRSRNIRVANSIVFECDLFKKYLGEKVEEIPSETIYLCKKEFNYSQFASASVKNKLSLVYLGSLNNIFDVELTSELINQINKTKPIEFHIIGDGEKKELLFKQLQNVEVVDHGIIYDEEDKAAIYSKCHFGLNLMKSSVFVGLTMKSIDYFAVGLPLINNIPGDTERIIDEYQCGYNYMGRIEQLSSLILSTTDSEIDVMRRNTQRAYEENFTEEIIQRKLKKIL